MARARQCARAAAVCLLPAALAFSAATHPLVPITFELAKAEGLSFVTDPSRTDHKRQPETMVSGVALFDYDNDGRLDVFAVNGAQLPALDKSDPRFWNRLYHAKTDGTFEDVTARAGVAGKGYDLGVAVGDYDNDGWEDLLVLGLRQNLLYHNDHDGTFSDVTAKAGLGKGDPRYGTLWAVAAAFFDYDNDGWLDLFVSNYCVWDPETEPKCVTRGIGSEADYCHPRNYQGLPNSLFHNNGDGTFTDVSVASGVRDHVGKSMGVSVADFDGDGWPDVFVANDTLPSLLFRNQGNGTFREIGFEAGVAYLDLGQTISGMGADAKDVDNDGREDIFFTALATESHPLFLNKGDGTFEEVTGRSGLGLATRRRSGWSNGIYDFNNDGWKDLFVAGGGVMDTFGVYAQEVPQTNAVFANEANGRFSEVADAGRDFSTKKGTHRGAAFGDLDNDGRIDAVVTDLHGPLEVWHNASPGPAHWLTVDAPGTRSNRDGIGARITVRTASGTQYGRVNTAVGYGCASDRRVHFGLGADESVMELRVTWPSGRTTRLQDVKADQFLTVREPES